MFWGKFYNYSGSEAKNLSLALSKNILIHFITPNTNATATASKPTKTLLYTFTLVITRYYGRCYDEKQEPLFLYIMWIRTIYFMGILLHDGPHIIIHAKLINNCKVEKVILSHSLKSENKDTVTKNKPINSCKLSKCLICTLCTHYIVPIIISWKCRMNTHITQTTRVFYKLNIQCKRPHNERQPYRCAKLPQLYFFFF